MTLVRFAVVPPELATDPRLRADLLETWVAVTDTGGAVGFTPPAPIDEIASTLDATLARVAAGTDALGVLRSAGRAVGMGVLTGNGTPLMRHWRTVLRVMVHPEFQGGGAGATLMRGLHDLANELGLEHLRLTIRDGLGLEHFYARFGYQVVGRHPGAIRVAPGDDRDEVHLVAKL
jgi:GNAT superfamily N-acetyltransferase